jgi:hypothetical protein
MRLAEFPAVRIAGDAEWELDAGDLCHWEAIGISSSRV